jgi:hypothetical protein
MAEKRKRPFTILLFYNVSLYILLRKAKEQVKCVAKALKELLQSPLYFHINSSHELPPKINP